MLTNRPRLWTSLCLLALFAFPVLTLSMTSPAEAKLMQFQAVLDQDQAIPAPEPVPNAGGRAYLTLDTNSNQIAYVIEYFDLSGEVTAMHFHGAAKGDAGGVVMEIETVTEEMGKLTGEAQLTAEQAKMLLDGLWYVNIHTGMNPPGELRGQLLPQ